MAKRGRTPSLIGGTHGTPTFDVSGKSHPCKRCEVDLPKGTTCVRVKKPGQMGNGRTYCVGCFKEILGQTQKDLDALGAELRSKSS